MPKFTLMVSEVWTRAIQIEASSLKEVMRLYSRGLVLDPDAELIDENLEFSHVQDVETWTADDDQGKTYYGDDLVAIAKELGDERRRAWHGLNVAVTEFNKLMNELILDERDGYPDFSQLVKEHCGALPQKDEADSDYWNKYTSFCKQAEAAVNAAKDLARAYRRCDSPVEIAKLEEEFSRKKHVEEGTPD